MELKFIQKRSHRLALIFLMAVLFAGNSFAVVIKLISIPANAPWTDTGIDVPAGSTVLIQATGKVIYWSEHNTMGDADGVNWDGRKFFPNAVLPDTVVVSLIGKIGGSSEIGTGTLLPSDKSGNGPGFVGKSYAHAISTGGRLFLGYNDTPNAFGDNIGSFGVSIEVIENSKPTAVKDQDPQIQSAPANKIQTTGPVNPAATVTSTEPNTGTESNIPKSVDIGIYAGIQIQGYANELCGIQCCTDLAATNSWIGLTNVVPDSSNYIWFDTSKTASSGQRFYRIIPGPISIP